MFEHVDGGGEPAREGDCRRVTLAREAVDGGSAREGQAQQSCDLVEGLAGGIIECLSQRGDGVRHVVDAQQRGVPTADEHGERRLRQRPVLQAIDRHVCRQVVHAVERLVQRECQGLRRRDTNEQRTDEARPARHGDGVDIAQGDAGFAAAAFDGRHHGFQMGTRGDLGDDPTETRVLINARRDGVGEQRVPAHDADTGFVARGFDAQHKGFRHDAPSPPHPHRARSSWAGGR